MSVLSRLQILLLQGLRWEASGGRPGMSTTYLNFMDTVYRKYPSACPHCYSARNQQNPYDQEPFSTVSQAGVAAAGQATHGVRHQASSGVQIRCLPSRAWARTTWGPTGATAWRLTPRTSATAAPPAPPSSSGRCWASLTGEPAGLPGSTSKMCFQGLLHAASCCTGFGQITCCRARPTLLDALATMLSHRTVCHTVRPAVFVRPYSTADNDARPSHRPAGGRSS
jgi:hypothetical protein